MEQKAISVATEPNGSICSGSLDELNCDLNHGWLVVSVTPVPISAGGIAMDSHERLQHNTMTGDLLVILQRN